VSCNDGEDVDTTDGSTVTVPVGRTEGNCVGLSVGI